MSRCPRGNSSDSRNRNFVDTLQLLIPKGDDISKKDRSAFFEMYNGSVEGLELMLSPEFSHVSILHHDDDDDDDQAHFPPLATALRIYGADMEQGERLLRKLVREGIDLHTIIPIYKYGLPWPFGSRGYDYPVSNFYTPLDELFSETDTPFEAKDVAKGWLHILWSEGIDVLAYLEEEISLHPLPTVIAYRSRFFGIPCAPRQLVFEVEGKPSVSWDWYFDPESPTTLLRKEFAQIISIPCFDGLFDYWDEIWPFQYSLWRGFDGQIRTSVPRRREWRLRDDYERHMRLTETRALRREGKKAIKLARAQGRKWPSKMPGSWIP